MPYLPYAASAVAVVWLLNAIRRTDSSPRQRWLIAAWALAVAAGAVITATVSTGRGTPFGDFDKAYYAAGRLAVTNPGALYACGHADGLCFVNLPVVALAFVPLAAIPPDAAHLVVVVVSVVAVALAIALLFRLVDATRWSRLAITSLVLLNGPLYYSLRLGNLTHVVLAMLAGALLAWRLERRAAAGVLLAVCAVLKPPFLAWLPYLALRDRSRRAPVSFVLTLAGLLAISLLWFGVDVHRTWIDSYVAGTASRPVGAYNAQSISGMLIRLTTTAFLVNWTGVDMGTALKAWTLGLELLVAASVVWVFWQSKEPASFRSALAEQSLVICGMLLVSPISWTHYHAWLLIPMAAWAAGCFATDSPAMNVAFATAATAVSLPVTLWIPGHPLIGPVVARLLLSHYVAGCALLLAALAAWRIQAPSTIADADTERGLEPQWNPDAI